MNSETTPTVSNKRLTVYLVSNFLFVLFMLVAVLMIRNGQAGFVPHAEVNKEYVSQMLATGSAEEIDKALKLTEVYRASGYENLVGLMDLMQISGLVMALLFVINGFVLFRLRQPAPTRAPVHG